MVLPSDDTPAIDRVAGQALAPVTGRAPVSARGWWLPAAAVLAVLTLAGAYLAWVGLRNESALRDRLASHESRSTAQFDGWLDAQAQQALRWAERPQTRELAAELLGMLPASPETLASQPAAAAFRNSFMAAQTREGLVGYFLLAPDGTVLTSLAPYYTGRLAPFVREPEFFEQMRSRGAALSPLMTSEQNPQSTGVAFEGQGLTLFVGVPIRLGSAEPAAYLVVRLPPLSLLVVEGRARSGETGFSYLVDRHGRLHADRVWLDLDLAAHGLTGEPFRGRNWLFARDPGDNLLLRPGNRGDRSRLPLTRAAAGVHEGHDGMSLEPYRDHRGVWVVGSWKWDPRLGLGVVTEIDAREANAPVARARQNLLVAGAVAAALASVALLVRLGRSRADLRAALVNAEATSRAKGIFVANMSHEIRTPLNAVLGIAHLLGTTPLSASQREYLRMISTSGEALLGILNDILDYSKVEAGKLEIVEAPFSLHDTIDTLASIMSVNAAPKDIELVIGIEPDVPTHLVGDAHRLLQLLVNLTGNAIKFTSAGQVALRVATEARDGDALQLVFEVRDTGVGIAPERQAHLFQAFTQADAGIARQFGGTGLGLAICKRLVDLMGGRIGVRSEVGEGSEFWLVLPMRADVTVRPEHAKLGAVHDVLVVDDSPVAREFVSKSVERLGWVPHALDSGTAAIARLSRAAPDAPGCDVVLIDWQMPGLDGLATSRAIRGLPGLRQPLVIMVTSFGREQVEASAHADAVDAVINQPSTPSKIFDAVMEASARRGGAPASSRRPYAPARAVKRLQGLELLLVEDNYINQQVARGILEGEGASITSAEHGGAALDILSRQPERFALVLMDVQMPTMDGIEATRRIRDVLRLDLPVVAMSAGVTQSERQACVDAGMNDFIAKPLDPDTVVQTLRRLRGVRRDMAAPAPRPAAHASGADDLPAIDGLDVTELGAALDGQAATVRRLLVQWGNECEQTLDTLDAALGAGDEAKCAALLHTFKGVAANMRAVAIAEAARGLEDVLRRDGLARCAAEFPGFRERVTAHATGVRRAVA